MSRYTNALFIALLSAPAVLPGAVAVTGHITPLPAIQAPLAKDSLLLDIEVAGNRRIVVGVRGHILVSDDGKSWRQSGVPTRAMLTGVYFRDSNRGWAVGHDAVILGTKDGGRNWQLLHFAPELEAPFLDVLFVDDEKGIAIGAYGLFFTSDDGGETWKKSELVVEKELENDEAGASEGDFAEFYDLHLNAITRAPDGTLYIAAEAGRIYRSVNGGRTWVELVSPYVGSFFGVLALQDGSVLVFGLRGHLYRSPDRGNSWQELDTPVNEMLTDAIQLDDGRVIIVGLGGTVLDSERGYSFTLRETGTRRGYSALEHTDGNRLTLVGEKGIDSLQITNN